MASVDRAPPAVVGAELQELRTQFSMDLERTRDQVAVVQERTSATERRGRLARSARFARRAGQWQQACAPNWRPHGRGRRTLPWPAPTR